MFSKTKCFRTLPLITPEAFTTTYGPQIPHWKLLVNVDKTAHKRNMAKGI